MKYLKSLSEHYWKRFREEYLLELRNHHVQGGDPVRKPEVGDVVVIEGLSKRNHWRLGRILSFITGSDGRHRGAVLKYFDGTKNRSIQRPIERLYPIEVRATVPVSADDALSANNSYPADNNTVQTRGSTEDTVQTLGSMEDTVQTLGSTKNTVHDRPSRVATDEDILCRGLAKML